MIVRGRERANKEPLPQKTRNVTVTRKSIVICVSPPTAIQRWLFAEVLVVTGAAVL